MVKPYGQTVRDSNAADFRLTSDFQWEKKEFIDQWLTSDHPAVSSIDH